MAEIKFLRLHNDEIWMRRDRVQKSDFPALLHFVPKTNHRRKQRNDETIKVRSSQVPVAINCR